MIFRYPGGKSRLLDRLQPYLVAIIDGQEEFHDVFVGGGSVAIEIAKMDPRIRIYVNDLDEWMAAFWRLVARAESADYFLWLLHKSPTVELFRQMREETPETDEEKAYHAVFFNRTTFSGIRQSGPIGGYDQSSKWGIGCRYNADRLTSEFEELRRLFAGRLKVRSISACEYLEQCQGPMYLDPPYIDQGDALYDAVMSTEDHKKMSEILRRRDRWVLSYDNHDLVHKLYGCATISDINARYSVSGEKSEWKDARELVIAPGPVAEQALENMIYAHPPQHSLWGDSLDA